MRHLESCIDFGHSIGSLSHGVIAGKLQEVTDRPRMLHLNDATERESPTSESSDTEALEGNFEVQE